MNKIVQYIHMNTKDRKQEIHIFLFICGLALASRAKGWRMYGMDSKLKLGDQLKKPQNNLNKWGIYNLNTNSFIISRVLRILASQKRFQSLFDEIYNIDRFVE